jgi:SAM-dependent methyltransferase
MSSFDLHTEQGKWRKWDTFFDKVFESLRGVPASWQEKTALDLGCATGWSTQALAKRFSRVMGVDGDATLIARAKQAANATPVAKKMVFERADDLATWDAFGERFDFIFSGYTLAYLGDVTPVLRQWASLLKPGGVLVVLEIQGLFSVHSPLGQYKIWFEKFDNEVLKGFGYTSNAGAQMADALPNVPELLQVAYLDWEDAELSFNGPLSQTSPVYLGWEERWKRLWPLMSQSGTLEEGLHDAFFSCLTNPEHKCDKPLKMLICRKVMASPARPDPALREDADEDEHLERDERELDFAGVSGGPDDGDQ